MFTGEYDHTLDAKGRLIVPSKFREKLGNNFWITKGSDTCLTVYSEEEWRLIEENFAKMSMMSKDRRKFMRKFFSGAAECEVDKQGRVLIPAKLREFAEIDKEVVSVGVGAHIEIWSKPLWEAEMDDSDESAEDMEELYAQMEELGIRF